MDPIFQQLLNILVAQPGNLVYHLALAFFVFSCLQAITISRPAASQGESSFKRTLLGLFVLLAAQLALFAASGLAWQGVVDSQAFLPIFDRAIILLSLLWIAWLWAFPTPPASGAVDFIHGLLNLTIIGLFAFTYSQWRYADPSVPFNSTWLDWIWIWSSLAVALLGILLLAIRRPGNWGVGIGMLGLAALGAGAHLLLPATGEDYSGYLRLALLAAFPFLPGLLARGGPAAAIPDNPTIFAGALGESGTDPAIGHLRDTLQLLQRRDSAELAASVTRSVTRALGVDAALVIRAPASLGAPLAILGGYDAHRDEEIRPVLVDPAQAPLLADALSNGRPSRFLANGSPSPDQASLSIVMGLPDAGNTLLLPLIDGAIPWGGLLLLSPHSKRDWSTADQSLLAAERDLLVKALREVQPEKPGSKAFEELRASLVELGAELDELRRENQNLAAKAEAARSMLQPQPLPKVYPPEFEQLRASLVELGIELDELRRENKALAAETFALRQTSANAQVDALLVENARLNDELNHAVVLAQTGWGKEGFAQRAIPQPTDETAQVEEQMRSILTEVARLQNQLAESQMRVLELTRQTEIGAPLTNQEFEVVISAIQDLRQPMAAVVGYTDVLLAETIGILGATQKRFLERMRTAAERMRKRLNDLVQTASRNPAAVALMYQPVELNVVLDAAISEVSARLREKQLELHTELADDLPIIRANRDGILQILNHLLLNAANVTPNGGKISLSAGLRKVEGGDFLIIKVTDQGGGIRPQDLPMVFNPPERGKTGPLAGVAEAGVSLSIAKTIVEAYRWRIWVESDDHLTSTYSLLLPVQPIELRDTGG